MRFLLSFLLMPSARPSRTCVSVCVQVCVPEPPLGQAPGADPLHAALQVEQSRDGLFQTLFILVILTLLLQLLWKQRREGLTTSIRQRTKNKSCAVQSESRTPSAPREPSAVK